MITGEGLFIKRMGGIFVGGTLDCYNNVYVFIVIRIQFSDVI